MQSNIWSGSLPQQVTCDGAHVDASERSSVNAASNDEGAIGVAVVHGAHQTYFRMLTGIAAAIGACSDSISSG
jgi:hypothetical protein